MKQCILNGLGKLRVVVEAGVPITQSLTKTVAGATTFLDLNTQNSCIVEVEDVPADWETVAYFYYNGVFKRQLFQSLPMAEARATLILAGYLPEAVDALIESIPDETARALAYNEWFYQPSVNRASALVASLATGLGLTENKLEVLFIAGSMLVNGKSKEETAAYLQANFNG